MSATSSIDVGGPGRVGPRIDVHAHPGRCFLDDKPRTDPFLAAMPNPEPQAAYDDLRLGRIAAVSYATVADFLVLGLVEPSRLGALRPFATGEAVRDHHRQLDTILGIAKRFDMPVVRSAADIDMAHRDGRTALFLTCEGADFAEDDLGLIDSAHDAGVRSITIVHYRQNAFGDLQTEPPLHGGLSQRGRELVSRMNKLRMIIDLAHASYETTRDTVEMSSAPTMISHTHLRHDTNDSPRLVSLEHARVVADAGGLIGAWPSGVRSATFENFVDEIIFLVDAIGVERVGIGTDMDGNYRPVMTRFAQFDDLSEALSRRGLSNGEVDRVLGGNARDLVAVVCG